MEIEEVWVLNYQRKVKSLIKLIEEYRVNPEFKAVVGTKLETIDKEDETNVERKNHQDILIQPTIVKKEFKDTFVSDAFLTKLINYSNNTYNSSSRYQEIP